MTTDAPLTDDELAAIEARLRAITDPPWSLTWAWMDGVAGGCMHGDDPPCAVCVQRLERFGVRPDDWQCPVREPHWETADAAGDAHLCIVPTYPTCFDDGAFIANAPADIDALLAEVERLRAFVCSQCQSRPVVANLTVDDRSACDRCWWLNMGIEPGMLPPISLPRSDGSGDQTIYLISAEGQDE